MAVLITLIDWGVFPLQTTNDCPTVLGTVEAAP